MSSHAPKKAGIHHIDKQWKVGVDWEGEGTSFFLLL